MGKKHKKRLSKKHSIQWSAGFYKKNYVIYIILGISLVFAILLFDPKLDTGGDNAVYILLGKSLISGNGYCEIFHPLNFPHTQYPPGYPLLLGAIMAVTGENLFFLKVFSLLLSLGSVYIFYLIFRREKLISYLVLFLFAGSPVFLENSHLILSEASFLFFVLLTIYLLKRWESQDKKILFIFASVSAITCYFVRTIGISMILGAIVYLLYRHKFKEVLVFLFISLAFILPWSIRNNRIPHEGGYLTQFLLKNPYDINSGYATISELVARGYKNFKLYSFLVLPGFIFPSYHPSYKPIFLIISGIILGITIYGLIREFLSKRTFVHFFLLFYIIIILGWPSVWSSERFLFPVLPFILFYFFNGISKIASKYPAIPIFFGVISIFTSFHETFPRIPSNLTMLSSYGRVDKMAGYTQDWRNYYLASDWIRENTSLNAVVVCRKTGLFYLRAKRKAFCYPMTYDHSKVLNAIKKADYILVDSFFWTGTTRKYLIPVVSENREKFEVAYVTEEPKTFVLKVKRDSFK